MANIGGVNIGVGIDLSSFEDGIKKFEKRFNGFTSKIKNLKLESVIKGDSFKNIDAALKTSQKELQSTFTSWGEYITRVSKKYDTFTEKSINNTKSIIQQVEKHKFKIESIASAYSKLGKLEEAFVTNVRAGSLGNKGSMIDILGVKPEDAEKIVRSLKQAKVDFQSLTGKKDFHADTTAFGDPRQFAGFLKGIRDQLGLLESDATSAYSKLGTEFQKAFQEEKVLAYKARMAELRKEIAAGVNVDKNRAEMMGLLQTKMQEGNKLSQNELATLQGLYVQKMKVAALDQDAVARQNAALTVARSVTDAEARRTVELRKMEVADAKANTELQMGINVLKNRSTILGNLAAKEQLGIKLTEEQLLAYQRLYVQQNKMQKFRGTTSQAEYKGELQLAQNINENRLRRREIERGLNLEIAKARGEFNIQMNVLESQKRIYDALNKKKQLGIALTREEALELRKLGKMSAVTGDKNAFLSPEWFKYRMKWFLQLRGAWAAWQLATQAFSGAIEFETEMQKVQAITQATSLEFEKMKQKALEVGSTTIFSAKEAAEGMYVLSQAGLTASQVIGTIKDVAVLSSATMFDLKRTSEIIVTVMKAWKYNTEDTKKATDILATAINATKLNMEDLATAFGYVSGIAPQLGMSLQETTAALGTLSNNGLNASIAATSLRAVLAELLQPSTRFQRELKKTGLTLMDVNPEIFTLGEILVKLKKAGWDAANTFRAFERRAAAGAALLISNAEAYQDMVPRMYEHNRALEMSEEILGSVGNQWKQFKDILIATTSTILDRISPATQQLIQLLGKLFILIGKIADIGLARPFAFLAEGLGVWATVAQRGIKGLEFDIQKKELGEMVKKAREFRDKIDEVVTRYRNLATVTKTVQTALSWSTQEKNAERSAALLNKALKQARDNELITREEEEHIKNIKDYTKRREELEKLINRKFEERKSLLANELESLKDQQTISKDITNTIVKSLARKTLNTIGEYTKAAEVMIKRFGEKESAHLRESMNEQILDELKILFSGMSDETIKTLTQAMPEMQGVVDAWNASVKAGNNDFLAFYAKKEKVVRKIITASRKAKKELEDTAGVIDTSKPPPEEDPNIKALKGKKDSLSAELRLLEVNKEAADMEGTRGAEMLKIHEAIRDKKIEIAKIDKQINKSGEATSDVINAEYQAVKKRAEIEFSLAQMKERKRDLTAQKESLEYTKQEQTKKIETLDLDGLSKEEAEKRNKLLDERTVTNSLLVLVERELNLLEKKSKEQVEELTVEMRKALEADVERLRLAGKLLYIQTEQEKIAKEAANKVSVIEQELAIMKINNALTIDILKKEEERLQVRYDELSARVKIVKGTKDEEELLRQKRQIETDILENLEKQKRATKPIYDAWIRIRDKVQEYNQLVSDVAVMFVEGMAQGVSNSLYDATGGFQNQQQEVEELKGKITELNEEYKEAMGEGNTQRAEELKNQIRDLKNEISDLENPIKQVGETFKTMFKETIDGIRKAIIEWLTMQAVMKIGSMAFPGGGSTSTGSTAIPITTARAAHGGILPSIKSFRAFSQGGITGSPTLALLGDNKSGKELVIPSEQIEDDSVSGYMRDRNEKTPINVVNLVTPEEISRAMSGPVGKRTILNVIMTDREKRMSYNI